MTEVAVTALESGRLARWRHGTFGSSDEPFRRRVADAARVVIAVAGLAVLISHAGHPTRTEQSLFEFFNSLPATLKPLFQLLYGIGLLWAVGLIAAAAFVARRWRLAGTMLLSALLTWFAGRVIASLVGGASVDQTVHAVARLGTTQSFPLVRLAVVVAVVGSASPFLTRPMRRLGQVLILLLAVAAMYLGTGYPNDLLAAVLLGWGMAAAVHLVFGSPAGRPTRAQVVASLEELGFDVATVHLSAVQPSEGTLMLTEDAGGPLWVKVLGRDDADTQWAAKAYRSLAYKDAGPTLTLTRMQELQREAYAMLLAGKSGVRVPDVLVAATAGPGAALLVVRPAAGPRLSELVGDQISDELLDALWAEVEMLHDARLAHGSLNTSHVVVGPQGPVIVDFSTARFGTAARQNADVAELLASTAAAAGTSRAVAALARVGDRATIVGALGYLQSAALTRQTRAAFGDSRRHLKKRLAELRSAAAAIADAEPPNVQQLHRVNGQSLLMAIGALIAISVLLSELGSPQELWQTVKHAEWVYVFAALALSMATNVAFAIALFGAVPGRLPFWPTVTTQVACSFSNLAVPYVGGAAVQIRYLQKQGIPIADAVASGGALMGAVNLIVQVVVFMVSIALIPDSLQLSNIDASDVVKVLMILIVVVLVGIAVVMGVPRLRRTIVPPVKQGASTILEALHSPRRMFTLIGGNLLVTVLYGLCLMACIAAYGNGLPFWTILAVNIGVSTIAGLVPLPGGGAAISAVGLSGALVAFGVSESVAVAAVLTNQLVVTYLPAIPGWFATRSLLERDYL
ncbi:MAG TPA: lysylphosphatidylglycerol synthase domain-containing protein [Acidimicrobiales bacterium]|jgi:undecaprenyl-diphosphatase|nr:lysylphosphatidylglycerol synthase domain-containing protein [Acidimicrobiales bacterium]